MKSRIILLCQNRKIVELRFLAKNRKIIIFDVKL
jgi:hypothetical protein